MTSDRLFLIGYRGTGKSTVGRCLAQRLGWAFLDADAELEARTGSTIRSLFAIHGEAYFRLRESEVIADLALRSPVVIATGGGVILSERNRELLRVSGFVVWLTASVDRIHERISADASTFNRRPNLSVGGRVEIEQTLRSREPLYRATCHLEISTEDRSPDEIATAILTSWTSTFSEATE